MSTPLPVVTYSAWSGPIAGVRSRPLFVTLSDMATVRQPSADSRSMRSCSPLRTPSTSPPFQVPHAEPFTNVAPDGAMVGHPDDHDARMARGYLRRSVIGALSSYCGRPGACGTGSHP